MLRQYHIRFTCISWFNPLNYMTRIINSFEFNNFIFVKLFLLNYMIIKINTCKIENQPNAEMFICDHDNLIKNKIKQMKKLNSQSAQVDPLNLQLGSCTLHGFITLFFQNYFLVNYTTTKIDTRRIKYKLNVRMFT